MVELGIEDARKGLGTGSNRTSKQGTNSEVFQYLPESNKSRPSTNNKRNNNRNKININIDKLPRKTLQQWEAENKKLPGPYSNLKDGQHFIPGDKWHQAEWTWVINGHPVTGAEALAIKTAPHIKKVVKPIVKHLQRSSEIDRAKKEAFNKQQNEAIAALEIGKKANRIRKEIQHQVFDRMTSADNPDYPTQSKHEATNLQRAEHLNRLNELGIQKPR